MPRPKSENLTPAGIALIYAAFASLWMTASAFVFTVNAPLFQRTAVANGFLFVTATSLVMFLLARRLAGDPSAQPATTPETTDSRRPTSVAIMVFVLAAVPAGLLVRQSELQQLEEQRDRLSDQAGDHANIIQRTIENALSATYALAALVHQSHGNIDDIDDIEGTLRKLLAYYPGAASLQLAPGGVIKHVVPLAGNEKAIGHDLLRSHARDKEAARARDSGQLTLAGPFKLIQGGTGAVGRLPVFLEQGSGPPSFWGFTTVLIRFPEVLDSARLDRLQEQNVNYELWRVNPDTGQKQVIAASASAPVDPVARTLNVPNGIWVLAIAPTEGWGDLPSLTLKITLALVFSLMMSYLARLLVELRQHKQRLEGVVALRTAEIVTAQKKLQAIFDAIPDLIWLKDADGVYRDCNPAFERLWHTHKSDLLGKTDYALTDKESAEFFREQDRKTVAAGKPCTNEEWVAVAGNGRRLFETTKTPMHDADGELLGVLGIARDITERKQAEDKLHLAASVFTHAREGIMITDTDGTILDVNEAFTAITGYGRDEAVGQTPRILNSGLQGREFYEALWHALIDKGYWYGEVWNRRKNGEVYAEMQTIGTVRDAKGNPKCYVALFSDITSHKEHQKQLEHIAHYDALTSLPNRVLLADRLHQGMAQAVRRNTLLGVAYIDLDGFKAINDSHGHEAGDQLLIAVANRMKHALRDGDTLARLGGDEFVAVLVDLADTSASLPLLSRLLDAASQPVSVGKLVMQVSASLGITFYPQAEEVDADHLLRQADQAMYQAKLAGRRRYHVFDAEQDRSLRGHHESLEGIRHALTNGEFELYYQPKVNMRTGTVIGVEALIRWQHPERGMLLPEVFLPVIEDHPLSIEVGEWVINSVLRQMELWHAAGLGMQVSINISAHHLQQPDFVSRLRVLLSAHPAVKPADLELEVLETSALENLDQVSRVIQDCQMIGMSFALDDFGAGYSSLTYLKRLPVNLLKIDQSFVFNMLNDPDDMAILKGTIGLAAAFRRQVIAEGVETVEHGQVLLQLGCELAQGYGIAAPMPANAIPHWLSTWQLPQAWLDSASPT